MTTRKYDPLSDIKQRFPDNSSVFKAYGTLIQNYISNAEKQFYATKPKARHTTTPAIVSALQDEYPKTRYWPVGHKFIPGSAIPMLLAFLPDRLVDRMFLNM